MNITKNKMEQPSKLEVQVKDIGVTIDNKLTFEIHINEKIKNDKQHVCPDEEIVPVHGKQTLRQCTRHQ